MPEEDSIKAPEPPRPAGTPPHDLRQPTKKKAAGVSKGSIVVLVVAIIGVVVVAWYKDNITAYWKIKPWDKASPCAYVDAISDAAKAGNADVLKAALGGDAAVVNVENGQITSVKPAASPPMMPPADASCLRLTGKAIDGEVTFDVHPIRPTVTVRAPNEGGLMTTMILALDDAGKWALTTMSQSAM